jgi:RES domain-containing protein
MRVNTGALYTVAADAVRGRFLRYIRTRYAADPLSMYGAINNGGRYNVAGLFGALYLGFDRETCEAEVSHGIAAGLPFKAGAFTVWDYDVSLNSVVRLDRDAVRAAVDVDLAEITIPGNHWTASGIGEHLHKRGDVEGLVAPSAHLKEGLCLDIYLDRVKSSSRVQPVSTIAIWP